MQADSAVLREGLPQPIPDRIARLRRSRGYPVPWFVAWHENGQPTARGVGEPDFRVIASGALGQAIGRQTCWICGGRLGRHERVFLIGPMCAVNRVSPEPPSHYSCASWSARACPFLSQPKMERRHGGPGIRDQAVKPAGIMLERNPGVTLVWVTKAAYAYKVPNGILFNVGDPKRVEWWAHGRPATQAEVVAAIESGLPHLVKLADQQGADARAELEDMLTTALGLLPDDVVAA